MCIRDRFLLESTVRLVFDSAPGTNHMVTSWTLHMIPNKIRMRVSYITVIAYKGSVQLLVNMTFTLLLAPEWLRIRNSSFLLDYLVVF